MGPIEEFDVSYHTDNNYNQQKYKTMDVSNTEVKNRRSHYFGAMGLDSELSFRRKSVFS